MMRRLMRRDDGYVLVMVLGLGLVLLIVAAATLSSVSAGQRKSDTEADWNGALAAAYAGIEDYTSRVENDASYVRYGNSASSFSSASTGLTLPTGPNANQAFNTAANQPWAVVPGSDGKAKFRYEVDTSQYPATGVIRIRATGLVGAQTRSVIADLRQDGFSDFVYYTDFETSDPLFTAGNDDYCANYWWNRPPQTGNRNPNCGDIEFAAGDRLNGKIHSNDRITMCGGNFSGAITTASASNPLYNAKAGCSTPVFNAGHPQRVGAITMPATNSEMRKETRFDLPSEVPNPGCLYTGPTVIQLNSNGTMTVWSPLTKKVQISATGGRDNTALCGAPGTGTGALGSTAGATIPVLDLNLLYVQNVPTSSSDPNYANLGTGTFTAGYFRCTATGSNSAWNISPTSSASNATKRFPVANESQPATSTSATPAYGCKNGDLFIQGTLKGRMTAASENYIYITGDVRYANNQEDMIGLVGQNAIWIWNPMNNGSAINGTNRTVYASLLSLAHTIQVQNHSVGGPRGTLTVVGSMAQKFRGAVGTGSAAGLANGYNKDYGYDARLTYSAPPKYLTPTSTTYGTTQIAGVPSAFDENGQPRT